MTDNENSAAFGAFTSIAQVAIVLMGAVSLIYITVELMQPSFEIRQFEEGAQTWAELNRNAGKVISCTREAREDRGADCVVSADDGYAYLWCWNAEGKVICAETRRD